MPYLLNYFKQMCCSCQSEIPTILGEKICHASQENGESACMVQFMITVVGQRYNSGRKHASHFSAVIRCWYKAWYTHSLAFIIICSIFRRIFSCAVSAPIRRTLECDAWYAWQARYVTWFGDNQHSTVTYIFRVLPINCTLKLTTSKYSKTPTWMCCTLECYREKQ